MEKETKTKASGKTNGTKQVPKKLSKAGLWLRSNKQGIGEIVDMRAVLK